MSRIGNRFLETCSRISFCWLLVLVAMVSLIFSSGCALVKAVPAQDSGFLPQPELLSVNRDRAPFHGYWVDDPVSYERARFEIAKLYIAPIDTSHSAAIYKSASGSDITKLERIEEVEELGRYFQQKIKLILRNKKQAKLQIVDSPEQNVLSLKLALVQVVPTNPGINILGTAAGAFLPGGGLIKTFGEGSVAMEGLVEQVGQNIKIREQYKDREGQKVSLFSFKDYQRYAHIRVAIDDWAMQIVELLNTPHDFRVEEENLVSINPL